ncbi:MAG: adenylate/guanylate cyclase domain-containing protein, partial [Nitrospinota bacterium]
RREVAILISDLRRFTPLAESLSPEATISLLNRYFAAMIEVIQQHRGIIVDFFGDGILVFFDPWNGAVAPAVERAVRCAIEMQRAMERFRTEIQAEQVPQLEMGIGVNAGEVVVGNIGSETRAKYGIVGSAVNITQRIQTLAEGGEVVISETVYRYIQAKVKIKATLRVQLKGVQQPVTLYKVDRFADIPLSPALGNAEKPTASG